MGRELAKEIDRPFELAPTRHLQILDFELSHAIGHGGDFALEFLDASDCRLQVVGSTHPHTGQPT